MSLCCGAVCGRGVWEGTMPLAWLLSSFQSLSLLPKGELHSSGADSQVGGFVYVLEPCGSLLWTLLWGWKFFLLPQHPQVFSVRGFEVLFPSTRTLGCAVCLIPLLFLLVYLHTKVGPPTLPVTMSPAPVLQLSPCHESSSSRLSISTSPTSLGECCLFHTVQFSHSSGCFCF